MNSIGITQGSEEDRCVEEELEIIGMGSYEILEYMEKICKCFFFVIFEYLFQLADMILTRYFNMHF